MGTYAVIIDPERNKFIKINSIIISRDTKLPCSKTERYTTTHDGQTQIDCSVTQSEGPNKDVEFVIELHNEKLDLPKDRPAGQPIDVTYSYDQSGIVHCQFLDVNSKKKYEIELKPVGSLDIEDLKEDLDFKIE